jgi:hypothetical protein
MLNGLRGHHRDYHSEIKGRIFSFRIGAAMRLLNFLFLLLQIIAFNVDCMSQYRLNAAIERRSNLEGQSLLVRISLADETKRSFRAHVFSVRRKSLSLILTTSKGDTLRYDGPIMHGGRSDSSALVDSLWTIVDLLDHFGEPYVNGYHQAALPAGEYHLKVRAAMHLILGEYGGYNYLYSKTIDFEVVRPTGVEKEAQHILESGIAYTAEWKDDKAEAEFTRLLRDYPQSSYASKACELLLIQYNVRVPNREKREQLLTQYLLGHPNEYFVFKLVPRLNAMYRNDQGELHRFRNLLRSTTPGSLVERTLDYSSQTELIDIR